MHKEDLIHLHELMADISEYFDDAEEGDEFFDDYTDLDVKPEDIHQSKSEHKQAIFVLGNEMANVMADDEFSETGRVGARMEELANKNAKD
ncbi:MAG: UPF0058 family protein [Halobacteria archaeon]|nr:UPF0058 family protein [Halobacteria archaeon]